MHSESLRQGDLWPELSQLGGCRNPILKWILNGFDKHFDSNLTELKTTWNQSIRTFYRDVLSLNTKKSPLHTHWKLDNNGRFIQLIEDRYPSLDFAELVALRRYVVEVENVEAYFTEDMIAQGSLRDSKEYAIAQLKAYDLKEIVKTLFDFYNRSPDSDIFGSYFLKTHVIEIYIVPCIIFSMLIEEDFLDMAIGTLAHELAHGFHHKGADKDGVVWDKFGLAEPALVEGLAEFYTREFAQSFTNSRPSILRTFGKTAKYLPEIYKRYEQWGSEYGLETVYQAFIETRRNDIQTFDCFGQALADAGRRLMTG